MFFVKNLIVVKKVEENFIRCFKNKKNQKRGQKKSRREIIRFAKSL